MSDRLSDEDVAFYAESERTYYSTTPNTQHAAKALAREVQELRAEVERLSRPSMMPDAREILVHRIDTLEAEVERLTAERDDLSERFNNQAISILRLYALADQLAEALDNSWAVCWCNVNEAHEQANIAALEAWEAVRHE